MKIEDSVETVNTSAKIDIFKYEWEFFLIFIPVRLFGKELLTLPQSTHTKRLRHWI